MTALAQAFQELLAALDRTETLFFIGGSVASGAHGLDANALIAPGRAA